MNIIGIILVIVLVIMLVSTVMHVTFFRNRFKKIMPYGELVEVEGGHMHIYSMGNGNETIVLLPGLGVGLPSADFGPLMRKLSEKYTVVCVEYFGVGFSSITSKDRSCENYVEEIREVLEKSGFKAPYILMPHSISSIYSEYYASKYPKEVKGIISLDGTSTAFYEEMPKIIKVILKIAKIQQGIGSTSLMGLLTANKNKLISSGYTQKEINDMITFAGFSINDTLLKQMINSGEFIKETKDLPFPQNIPYFKIISKQTFETHNKQLKITPQEYQYQHLARIGKHAKFEVLDGSHFIYINNVEKISDITDQVILSI